MFSLQRLKNASNGFGICWQSNSYMIRACGRASDFRGRDPLATPQDAGGYHSIPPPL